MYIDSGGRAPKKSKPKASFGGGAKAGGGGGRSSGGSYSGGGGYVAPSRPPVYNPPPVQRYSSPSTNSRGNYSGGGAPSAPPSGGGGGPVQRTVAPRKPEPPSVKKYLGGDDEFQTARNQLIRNFQALRHSNTKNRGNLRQDYKTTKSRLAQEKSKAGEEMTNDFAARGLLGSGVYADKLAEFEKNYANQGSDAGTSYRRNVDQLLTDLRDAKRLRNQSLQQAKLEAIRRRAEKYGIKK